MQRNALTDTRIILINGVALSGLVSVSETGYDEDAVDVPESGYVRLIGSGVKKLKPVTLSYLVKRDTIVLKYFIDWANAGGFARDVTMYYTDKSGDILNAYRRDLFGGCELGTMPNQGFEEASRQKGMFSVTLYPYSYERKFLI